MIIVEHYCTRQDGTELVRTYSDKGLLIERNGVLYEEAIDPKELNRVYNETEVAGAPATETDYHNALRELGVKV